jgi:hypothetical protein
METTKLFTGNPFSFQYPENAQIVESRRPDGTFLVRLLQEKDGIKYRYDLEKLADASPAKEQAERYFRHPIAQPEDLAPEIMTLQGMETWHTRKVVFDGLRAVMLYEAVFLTIGKACYRLQYMAYTREFEAGLPTFQTILATLTLSN